MKTLLLAVSVAACGGLAPVPTASPMCTGGVDGDMRAAWCHCLPSEVGGNGVCVNGLAFVCEPTVAPCYPWQMSDGRCTALPDGGAQAPDLLAVHNVWQYNGTCAN